MPISSDLAQTLLMASETAAEADDPWWIIGSAAVALHGADVAGVRDVDLLMSVRDAERALQRIGSAVKPGLPSARFHSTVFGTWLATPLPIEIMGGFSIATSEGWVPVRPTTREAIMVGGCELFIPTAGELGEILVSMGRQKDLDRFHLLRG